MNKVPHSINGMSRLFESTWKKVDSIVTTEIFHLPVTILNTNYSRVPSPTRTTRQSSRWKRPGLRRAATRAGWGSTPPWCRTSPPTGPAYPPSSFKSGKYLEHGTQNMYIPATTRIHSFGRFFAIKRHTGKPKVADFISFCPSWQNKMHFSQKLCHVTWDTQSFS